MVTDHFVLNKTSRDVTNGSGPNLVLRHNIHLMSNRCIYRWYEYRRVQQSEYLSLIGQFRILWFVGSKSEMKIIKIRNYFIINRLTCKGLSNQPQNYLGSVLCGQTGSNPISCIHRTKTHFKKVQEKWFWMSSYSLYCIGIIDVNLQIILMWSLEKL